jgi:murein DD-endopeptidase MepM/ murein hydrolase activator NlpD
MGERITLHCSNHAAWWMAFVASAVFAQTVELPKTVRQGGTLRIHGTAPALTARMADRRIRLFPQADAGWLGLMPIPADQKPGDYKIEVLDARDTAVASATVQVIDARFRKQNVIIEQSIAELKPSPGESETSAAFRKNISEVRYWSDPLDLPVHGCMTSPYGVQRYLNGRPTGDIHGGIDQRSPAGTPIRAVEGGVVKIVREWNLHGRTVAIDHGQGLESMYLHMSKFAVSEGAIVKKGDVIGYVGSTGRSTAPHLHWTLYVNGVPVNPLEWVQVNPCSAARTTKAADKRRDH